MSEKWLSTKAFCRKYGFHPRTLYEWKKRGQIRWLIHGKKNLRFLDPGLLENLTATTAPREVKDQDRMPILRGKEVALFLGISTRRIRQLVETGKLGSRMIGKHRRYTMNQVRELIVYREMRKELKLKNGDKSVPRPTPSDRTRTMLGWMKHRLADSP
jgi:excisionase family DNA binding protein